MYIICTAQVGDDAVQHQQNHELSPDEVVVIMVKRGPNGQPVMDSFEPLQIDDHNDTLREIGSRVVAFAEDKH